MKSLCKAIIDEFGRQLILWGVQVLGIRRDTPNALLVREVAQAMINDHVRYVSGLPDERKKAMIAVMVNAGDAKSASLI